MADIVGRFKRWKSYKKFTKLVGDMQEETYFNEKQSISEKASIRDFTKKSCYGATSNSFGPAPTSKRLHKTEVLIRHDLSKNETLQGIALKYGCSMEQIRRANRLFANDSLFLREFLMIPVDKDSVYYPKDAERPQSFQIRSNSVAGSSSSSSKDQLDSPNAPNTPSKSSLDSLSTLASPDEEQRKYMEEFLDKIDSSIATSKKFVQQQQKINGDLSSSQSEDNIYSSYGNGGNGNSFNNHLYDATSSNSSHTSYQQYYAPSSSHQHARFSLAGGSNSSDTTQLIVMTSGKRVKNSLQRLEKNHDELFEL